MLDAGRGVGLGEDEPQVAVPVGERADPLAGRDRDRQPGDAGHGQGTVPALDGAQDAGARHGKHKHARRAGRAGGGGDRSA